MSVVLAQTTTIEARIQASSELFQHAVWPLIASKFGAGELIAVEGPARDRLAEVVDYCGIDYLFRPSSGETFGIAQRTQSTPRDSGGRPAPWDSFTMRPAGLQRSLAALRRPLGQLLPAVLVHSYLTVSPSRATVDSIGVVRTRDLLEYALSHDRRTRSGPNGAFHYWTFDELEAAGVVVDRFPAPVLRSPF